MHKMDVTLGHSRQIHYTEEENLRSFCDVQIISLENDSFYINRFLEYKLFGLKSELTWVSRASRVLDVSYPKNLAMYFVLHWKVVVIIQSFAVTDIENGS